MSLNNFMHPRNRYKSPLNFEVLSEKYPEFLNYVQLKLNGKMNFNFKDPEALRCLTTVLLQEDFGLNVFIPKDNLVPTLSLRLNYILWLEDLLICENEKSSNIRGIDIGTGAVCIFPLLCAIKNGWEMLGTDIKEFSVKTALENIKNNHLEHLIEVREVSEKAYLLDAIKENEEFDFCMCNPPFFGDIAELNETKSRNKRRNKELCSTGMPNEIISPGGEIEFIKNIIKDSLKLKNRIRIYTTMIGLKSSLKTLIQELKNNNVNSFSQAQFYQGRTVRWALAWTFTDLILNDFLPSSQLKSSKPIAWILTPKLNFEECVNVIPNLMSTLKIEYKLLEKFKRRCLWKIIAHENTWTGLRRKRREQKNQVRRKDDEDNINTDLCVVNKLEETKLSKNSKHHDISKFESKNDLEYLLQNEQSDVENIIKISHSKRKIVNEIETENIKKVKIDTDEVVNGFDSEHCVIEAFLSIKSVENNKIQLQILYIRGSKEAPQQILQFFKNNIV